MERLTIYAAFDAPVNAGIEMMNYRVVQSRDCMPRVKVPSSNGFIQPSCERHILQCLLTRE